MTENTI